MLTGIVADRFGRKFAIMMLCIPLLASWVIIGLSGGRIDFLYLGRVLMGFGIMSMVSQVSDL